MQRTYKQGIDDSREEVLVKSHSRGEKAQFEIAFVALEEIFVENEIFGSCCEFFLNRNKASQGWEGARLRKTTTIALYEGPLHSYAINLN